MLNLHHGRNRRREAGRYEKILRDHRQDDHFAVGGISNPSAVGEIQTNKQKTL